MAIYASSSDLKISEREIKEVHFTLSFSIDFTTKQQCKSISDVQPLKKSKAYYLRKEKNSNIGTFLLKMIYGDVISNRKILSNGKINQILDNDEHNIIVTNYTFYYATTVTVKLNLPKLKVNVYSGLSVITLPNTWYIDNNNRLAVFLKDKNKMFAVQL